MSLRSMRGQARAGTEEMLINITVAWTRSGNIIFRLRGTPSSPVTPVGNIPAAALDDTRRGPESCFLKGTLWRESLQMSTAPPARESKLLERLKQAGHDISALVERRREAGVGASRTPPAPLLPARTINVFGYQVPVWTLPLAWLAISYLLLNFAPHQSDLPAGLSFYVLQPLPWVVLGGLSLFLWRRADRRCLAFRQMPLQTGLLLGGVQVAILVLTGVIFGFGNSPYSHRLLPMLGNTVRAGIILFAVEITRGYLSASLSRRSKTLALILTTVLFAFALTSVSQFSSMRSRTGAVTTLGELILPSLAENLLASFLVLSGGVWAALAYRGMLLAFEWLSPILPSAKWILLAFVETLTPIIGLLVVQDLFAPREKHPASDAPARRSTSELGWILVALVGVFLLWFNTGALGFEPTVLSGPSMRPKIVAGDLVITKEVLIEDIKVGDIIKFYQDGRFVVHRVVEIQKDEGTTVTFITKGDNMPEADPPVRDYQVKGKVVAIVPKAGYVSIWARNLVKFVKTGSFEMDL